MRMFGWMQNKLNARFGCNTLHSISVTHHPPRKEVGLKEEFSDWPNGLLAIGTFGNTKNIVKKDQGDQKEEENQEFTVEEVEKLEKELNLLLLEDESSLVLGSGGGGGKAINNNVDNNNNNNNINKKSFSFILKKMFRAQFTTTLNLRDQVPESRMEKILRAILHKKIYPQNPNYSTNSSTKKVLQKKHHQDQETKDNEDDQRSKWVKTDSEYIVLEI